MTMAVKQSVEWWIDKIQNAPDTRLPALLINEIARRIARTAIPTNITSHNAGRDITSAQKTANKPLDMDVLKVVYFHRANTGDWAAFPPMLAVARHPTFRRSKHTPMY
jgi:hypothetical protein